MQEPHFNMHHPNTTWLAPWIPNFAVLEYKLVIVQPHYKQYLTQLLRLHYKEILAHLGIKQRNVYVAETNKTTASIIRSVLFSLTGINL